jgi:hypothetical protein
MMFMNDRLMSQDLDNYITGHYGEDQFRDEPEFEGDVCTQPRCCALAEAECARCGMATCKAHEFTHNCLAAMEADNSID